MVGTQKGSFINHVVKIFDIFDPLCGHFYEAYIIKWSFGQQPPPPRPWLSHGWGMSPKCWLCICDIHKQSGQKLVELFLLLYLPSQFWAMCKPHKQVRRRGFCISSDFYTECMMFLEWYFLLNMDWTFTIIILYYENKT